MATLFAGECGSYLYRPQKFEVYLYPARSEYEAKKMAELIKDFELEVHYHPGLANVVADALSCKVTLTTCQLCVLWEKSLAPECYQICHYSTSPSHPP
jgi:hypothetical protein